MRWPWQKQQPKPGPYVVGLASLTFDDGLKITTISCPKEHEWMHNVNDIMQTNVRLATQLVNTLDQRP